MFYRKVFLLACDCKPSFCARSCEIKDLWEPSSNRMLLLMVVFAKVIGAIAVFNKHGCTALLDVIIEAVVSVEAFLFSSLAASVLCDPQAG